MDKSSISLKLSIRSWTIYSLYPVLFFFTFITFFTIIAVFYACAYCPAHNDLTNNTRNPLARETKLLELINYLRSRQNLSMLRFNKALWLAARRHSKDMAENNFLDHVGSQGSTFWQRIKAAGYQYMGAAENVAAGNEKPEKVLDQWMQSSGHRGNMLDPAFDEAAVGYAYDANSKYRHYWTLNLATPAKK